MSGARGVGAAFVVSLCVGCGASELDELRTRAAFDFQCPESSIKIRNLDEAGQSYGVSGCGDRGVYLWHCGGYGGLECKWVKND